MRPLFPFFAVGQGGDSGYQYAKKGDSQDSARGWLSHCLRHSPPMRVACLPFTPSNSSQVFTCNKRIDNASSRPRSVTASSWATTFEEGSPNRSRPCRSNNLRASLASPSGFAFFEYRLVGRRFFHVHNSSEQRLDQSHFCNEVPSRCKPRTKVLWLAWRFAIEAPFHLSHHRGQLGLLHTAQWG